METCELCSLDPRAPDLHCERPRPSTALFCESLKLLNFDFNTDPDPVFHSNADPASASKNNADPDPQP